MGCGGYRVPPLVAADAALCSSEKQHRRDQRGRDQHEQCRKMEAWVGCM